jgi:hypothetical protein
VFLKVQVNLLSCNDADYFLRELTKKGAEGKIVFGGTFSQAVVVTQKGTLEELLETASIAFHSDSFRIEISG